MQVTQDIYKAFSDQVRRSPDRIAVTCENASLTFAQLEELSAAIADRFPVDAKFVGIAMDHSVLMIASIFAVLRTGAAYVPVEPDFPPQRIRTMFDRAGVDLVLANARYADLAGERPLLVPSMDWKPDGSSKPADVPASAPAYVLFTSGSTGEPKGIIATNGNVMHYVHAFEHEFRIGPEDIMVQQSVCTFDIFVEEVFCSLLNGAQLAIAPPRALESVEHLSRFIEDNGVTIVSGFPYLLLEFNRLERIPDSIRLLISGGDVLRLGYVDNLFDQAQIYNTYGPAETTVCATYYRCTPENALTNGTFPVGYPVVGSNIRIVDDQGVEQERGNPGEILILGPGVTAGYTEGVDDSAYGETRGIKTFRTGDLGYETEDGAIVFTRRKDTQVMIRGRRVEPGEVENILCGIEGIATAHVLSATDDSGLAYLTAYIVPEDPDITTRAIRKELQAYLPRYMIPEFFVRMPAVPLTSNGKPDFEAFPVVLKEGRL